MSKLETPMTRWYWQQTSGTLMEEFLVVARSKTAAPRWVDGIILPQGELRKIDSRSDHCHVPLEGQALIVVQAKAPRLGMYLLGQALFSAELVRRFRPASVTSVALCMQGDSELERLLKPFPHIRVVVVPKAELRAGLQPGELLDIMASIA